MIVFDIKTFNTDRAVPYATCICRLSKLSVKFNRGITQREFEKCRKDCIVSKGLVNINEILDYILQFKGEPKEIKNTIVKYNLYLLAHKGSGFNSYVVLNNLPQWRTVVSLIKNGAGIVSLKILNGYVDLVKKIPQYGQFRCGCLHIKDSLKNI